MQVTTLPSGADGTEEPEAPATESTEVIQVAGQNYTTWNLCQGRCRSVHSSFLAPSTQYSRRVLRASVKARAAAAQEMCEQGYNDMAGQLGGPPYNFQHRFVDTKYSTFCNADIGIAIFWRGGCSPTQCSDTGAYANQHPADVSENHETRRWVCGHSGSFAAVYCSTHLTSEGDFVAGQQMAAYRNKSDVIRNWTGTVAVMMGDFNLQTWQENVGFANWYENNDWYIEGDKCNDDGDNNERTNCDKTFPVTSAYPSGMTAKYDFIFATRGDNFCFRQGSSPGFYGDVEKADHRFYRAYINCEPVAS